MFFSGNLAHGLGYLGIPRKFFKLGSGPAVAITRFVIHSFGIEGFIHGSCLSGFQTIEHESHCCFPVLAIKISFSASAAALYAFQPHFWRRSSGQQHDSSDSSKEHR